MASLKPRTIRGQLVAGLVLFELAVLAIFAGLLWREQSLELQSRVNRRLEYQASELAAQVQAAMEDGSQSSLRAVTMAVAHIPSVRSVLITDLQGRTLVSSDPARVGALNLNPRERTFLHDLPGASVFTPENDVHEVVAPVRAGGRLQALVWIYPDETADHLQMAALLRISLLCGLGAILACTLLATLIARSIARPLDRLARATRQIVREPENMRGYPLPVQSSNEIGDLTMAFNRMVASLEEQRAGLNDTLAILDSMLANAPIGFAFFDRKMRLVRVNQFMAEMNHLSINRHLGRPIGEVFSPTVVLRLEPAIEGVFETGVPVRDLEVAGDSAGALERAQTWLVNIYPVKGSGSATARWVGAIIVDTTERKRAEDALRKTEKLAAAGRLAASIAHEINNPLEAVTNLLYLLRHHCSLAPEAASYAELAQHEVARVSEITQQTLRFYRQSTLPVTANIAELIDSVLALHQGRVNTLHVEVRRRYLGNSDLFCFAGELRQVFANLIGNSLDAMMPGGGRLLLDVRPSRLWSNPPLEGIRVTVADTGCGMNEEVRQRIFEPFFTTKDATGTGLGLWVSAEILRKHDAPVRIRSRHCGKPTGTVFMLFFPLHAVHAVEEPQPADAVSIE